MIGTPIVGYINECRYLDIRLQSCDGSEIQNWKYNQQCVVRNLAVNLFGDNSLWWPLLLGWTWLNYWLVPKKLGIPIIPQKWWFTVYSEIASQLAVSTLQDILTPRRIYTSRWLLRPLKTASLQSAKSRNGVPVGSILSDPSSECKVDVGSVVLSTNFQLMKLHRKHGGQLEQPHFEMSLEDIVFSAQLATEQVRCGLDFRT